MLIDCCSYNAYGKSTPPRVTIEATRVVRGNVRTCAHSIHYIKSINYVHIFQKNANANPIAKSAKSDITRGRLAAYTNNELNGAYICEVRCEKENKEENKSVVYVTGTIV